MPPTGKTALVIVGMSVFDITESFTVTDKKRKYPNQNA
jgi:hypothetical protein